MAGASQQRTVLGLFRNVPDDLVAVVVLAAFVDLSLFVPSVATEPIWLVGALVFVCFLPGYAFVSALFPKSAEPGLSRLTYGGDRPSNDVATPVERVVLSLGLSLAIVAAVGLVLNASPVGIRRAPAILSLTAVTGAGTVVALFRRSRLPAEDRFDVSVGRWFGRARAGLTGHDSRGDGVATAFMVVSLVVALGAVGLAATAPTPGERYTELYILTETDDGELVFDDYPTEFTAGEPQPVAVRVRNQEYAEREYTVVVQQQRVTTSPNGSTAVLDRTELDRLGTGPLAHNDTWTQRYDLAPTATGESVRLTFLLYEGSPPDEPTVDNAYRYVALQVTVTE